LTSSALTKVQTAARQEEDEDEEYSLQHSINSNDIIT